MPRKSKKTTEALSPETEEAIKTGCQQSLEGKVTPADFSKYADDGDEDGGDGEGVICPICGHKCLSDESTHCEHVSFVVTENMVNRFNTTLEMDEWLDKNIGDDMCDTISTRKLNAFCKKFGIQRETLTEYGMCCGPACYEYIFGFKE
jgi:hypothetical protein